MKKQYRVPLHERGINIDELTFEMVAPGGRRAQCVQRPDIYLERICDVREERSDLYLLFVEELEISVIPISKVSDEYKRRVTSDPDDIVWIIGKVGVTVTKLNFVSQKYNPNRDKSIPTFKFLSQSEKEFAFTLILRAFSFHDDNKTYLRHEFPDKDIRIGRITASLSNTLSRLTQGGK